MENTIHNNARHDSPKYQLPVKYNDDSFYEFALIQREDRYYLTDQGNTLNELDNIFELSEPDVIKNLLAISKQFGVNKVEKEFTIDIFPWSGNVDERENLELRKSIYELYACVSFMLNMKIFYV